jgi:hypothetical protein
MRTPNILRINTIYADWCDNDIIMLHACFALLVDCVENEKLFEGNIDWSHTEETKNRKKEIVALYEWWKGRQKEADQNDFTEEGRAQYEQDNEMLIRLIKIRQYLWT